MNTADAVTGKTHYHRHPSGVECWDVVELMNFNLGNAVKYVWRYKLNGKPQEDLLKAANYLRREVDRMWAGPYDYPMAWYAMMREVIMAEHDDFLVHVFSAIFSSGGMSTDPVGILRMLSVYIEEKAADL